MLVWERAVEHALCQSQCDFYDQETALFYVRVVAAQSVTCGGALVKYAAASILAKVDAGAQCSTLIRKLRADVRDAKSVKPPICNTGVRSPGEVSKYHPLLVHYLRGY